MNTLGKIIVSVVIAAIVLAGGYFVWQSLVTPAGPTTSSPAGNNVGVAAAGKLEVLTSEKVFDFWTNPKTGDVYYVNSIGQILKLAAQGAGQVISAQAIPGLNWIAPSTDGLMALVALGYPQAPTFSIFNVNKKNFQPLPQGTTAADWDPLSNNRIAYLKTINGISRLNTMDVASGKSSELLRINQQDLVLDWGLANVIYLSEKPSSQNPNSVWSYDLKTKTLKILAREEKDLSIRWWAIKNIGLKWSNGALSLINSNNQTTNSIYLKTLPSKCFFDEPVIYCSAATAQDSVASRDLSNGELKQSSRSDESIYTINSFDLSASKLSSRQFLSGNAIGIKFHASHIEKQTNRLLILNEYDHKLYSLPL